jgi:hypothetical protein
MTRGEVARALRRSIATVRRIEGVYLHPQKGADGVHQFDPEEVRRLQADLASRSVRLAPLGFPNQAEHGRATSELARQNRIPRNLLLAVVGMVRSNGTYRRRDATAEELLDAAEEFLNP